MFGAFQREFLADPGQKMALELGFKRTIADRDRTLLGLDRFCRRAGEGPG